jgi:hypothetical protein
MSTRDSKVKFTENGSWTTCTRPSAGSPDCSFAVG